MRPLSRALLYLHVIAELMRHDVIQAVLGFEGVHRTTQPRKCRQRSSTTELEATVCEAVESILPLYWKRVRCLQRSVATARVLKGYGIHAEVVIGYRPAPFLAHAWVEVGGRIVNDSPVFQSRLRVLERF
jgi:hypothetical protein